MNEQKIPDRMTKILEFLKEIEKLKLVKRIPYLSDKKTVEDDAEHSWHLAMMVLVLEKELGVNFNILRAIKLALVHDLPEVYTGDDWTPDEESRKKRKANELASAKKIFAKLPNDLEAEIFSLWQEYEKGETVEAKVVKALDKISYSLQYNLSRKIKYDGEEASVEASVAYAKPYISFNKEVVEIFNSIIDERKEKELYKK